MTLTFSGWSDDCHYIEGVSHNRPPDWPLTAEITLPGGETITATITTEGDGFATVLRLPPGATAKVREATKEERGY